MQANVPVSTIAFGTDEGFIELEGDRVAVPVNHEQLQGIAEGTGGSYYEAASAEELSSVYRDLGSQIGYTVERREITTWFVGIGLLFAFAAAAVVPALEQPAARHAGQPGRPDPAAPAAQRLSPSHPLPIGCPPPAATVRTP